MMGGGVGPRLTTFMRELTKVNREVAEHRSLGPVEVGSFGREGPVGHKGSKSEKT